MEVPEPVTCKVRHGLGGQDAQQEYRDAFRSSTSSPRWLPTSPKGFKQHGSKFSPTLQEEWTDTQEQLGKALGLYDSCKKRKSAAGEFDKQLFLDLEEVWQGLVKTGVAGVRTKQMVDAELKKAIG